MSGTVFAAILSSLVPFGFPVVMQVRGLLTGLLQAYRDRVRGIAAGAR